MTRCLHQGSDAFVGLYIYISTLSQKKFHNFSIAIMRCENQSSFAFAILYIYISALIEKKFDNFSIATTRCLRQGSNAFFALYIHISALIQKKFNNFSIVTICIATIRCHHQSRQAVSVLCIYISSALQCILHVRKIASFCSLNQLIIFLLCTGFSKKNRQQKNTHHKQNYSFHGTPLFFNIFQFLIRTSFSVMEVYEERFCESRNFGRKM